MNPSATTQYNMRSRYAATRKRIFYVINPISGGKNKKDFPQILKKNLDISKIEYDFAFTESRHHATELARQAVANGFEFVVAVGGDGTVNETAQALIGTSAVLGIVPMGSGNGLSRHLSIPLNPETAVRRVMKQMMVKMDVAYLNDKLFLCTSGIGFDAYVGHLFATSEMRGFSSYVTKTLQAFMSYKPQEYSIRTPFNVYEREAFLVTFANANQYGNNAYIAPHASVTDGALDICIIKPFSKWHVVGIARRIFNKRIAGSMYYETVRSKEATVILPAPTIAHIDGEPIEVSQEIHYSVAPLALNIML